MRNIVFISFLMLIAGIMTAQTFTGSGGEIPDDMQPVVFEIQAPHLDGDQLDKNFGLLNVCVNIAHSWVGDLTLKLIAPDGTEIILSDGSGSFENFSGTCFDDNADYNLSDGSAPYTGSFKAFDVIGNVNNGQPGTGTWQLKIVDGFPENDGELLNWAITFGKNATGPLVFTSSDLPLVVINTGGKTIVDDPKIGVDFRIIYNGPGQRNAPSDAPAFQSYAGVEFRGSSSQMFPKKSMGITLWDDKEEDLEASLLGMPKESDWILNANYSDKTFARNTISYQIWQNMNHYGTRYKYVEVVINGEYRGIYILSEKIKRNKNRVNIPKMSDSDISGDAVTGGYIFKIDKATGSGGDGWTSKYPSAYNPDRQIYFLYEYPKEKNIVQAQKDYIKNFVDTFETALKGSAFTDPVKGYRPLADVNTFIDYFLVNEISKNVDGYRISTFMNKDRNSNDPRLKMGPVWDYDIAWYNANYCSGESYTGWAYQFDCFDDFYQPPFWWGRLLQDTVYTGELKCRWTALRASTLSDAWFDSYLDSVANVLQEGQERNFSKWPILGRYVWPNPEYPSTYAGEIENVKDWIHRRLSWMDDNLPGNCRVVGSTDLKSSLFSIGPNPARTLATIRSGDEPFPKDSHIELCTVHGVVLKSIDAGSSSREISIPLPDLVPGLYIVQIRSGSRVWDSQKLVIE